MDIDKYLESHKGKPLNPAIYFIMRNVVARSQATPMHLEIKNESNINKAKGPFLLLSNHSSRCDWEYIGMAVKKLPLIQEI